MYLNETKTMYSLITLPCSHYNQIISNVRLYLILTVVSNDHAHKQRQTNHVSHEHKDVDIYSMFLENRGIVSKYI